MTEQDSGQGKGAIPPGEGDGLARGEDSLTRLVPDPRTLEEALQLIQELYGRQIILEAQNEKLRRKLEELEASRTWYHELYTYAPVGYALLDERGFILESNLVIAALLGVSCDALIKQPLSGFILPEDQGIYYRYRRLLNATDKPVSWELRMLRADATFFWARFEAGAKQDPSGVAVFHFAISDITICKRTEEKQHLFKSVLDHSSEAVAISNASGGLIYINPAHERLFGRSFEEAQRLNYRAFYPPESIEILDKHVAPMLDRGMSWEGELDALDSDGRRFPLWERADSLRDASGRMQYAFGFMHDVSERKQTEKLLRESEERFRVLLQSIPSVAVQGYGPGGVTQYWNEASERIYGYKAKEAIGRNMLDMIIPPEMREDVTKAMQWMADTGQPIPASELSLLRRDGSRVPVFSSHAIVHIPGRPPELFCMDIDLTELKRAEETLRIQSVILSEMSEGVSLIRACDLVFIHTNPRFDAMFGYDPGELAGKHVSVINASNDLSPDDMANMIANTVSEHHIWQGDIYNIKKDGGIIWCHASVRRYEHSEHGMVYITVQRDITDRKHAEDSLRKSELLLNASQHISKTGGWEWDIDEQRMTWTDETYRIHDLDKVDILSGPQDHIAESLACYNPDDRSLVLEAFHNCVEQGIPYDLEIPFTSAKGRQLWVRTKARAIQENGQIVKVLGDIIDITERKQAEDALRASEERYRAIVENCNDAIYILNFNGEILDLNENACHMLGYTKEELAGNNRVMIDSRISDRYFPERMSQLLSKGSILFEGEHVKKSGEIVPVEVSCKVVSREGDGVIQSFVRDITERKRMEAERKSLDAINQQLMKNESLARMAGSIAHHFNNKLAIVMGFIDVAMDDLDQDTDPAFENLAEAMKAAKEAADTNMHMLTYLGQAYSERGPLDLSTICHEALGRLRAIIPNGIHIKVDFPSSGPIIHASAAQVQQVITCLVTNAWEAAPEGHGAIRITINTASPSCESGVKLLPPDWRASGIAYACLEVADTGCGIAPRDLDDLFDPFFSTKFTGRGLGLPVVLGIIRSHEGCITVESKPGRGSVFRVFLPSAPAPIA